MEQYKIKIIIAGICLFAVGIFAGSLINNYYSKVKLNRIADQTKPVRGGGEDYKFINPLLGYDTADATQFGEYQSLEDKLQKKVNDELGKSGVDKFSIYFRDLPRGRWVGVNEDAEFTPASLLKVPIMMIYYHLSESNPEILNQQIKFTGDINNIETIQGSKKISPDKPIPWAS